jgi:hypothetical protein
MLQKNEARREEEPDKGKIEATRPKSPRRRKQHTAPGGRADLIEYAEYAPNRDDGTKGNTPEESAFTRKKSTLSGVVRQKRGSGSSRSNTSRGIKTRMLRNRRVTA